MGEKETSREASAPSPGERSSVQDFEKNTEGREGVVQYNESDLEFREAGAGSESSAERANKGKPTQEPGLVFNPLNP